jgi:hypothetical protein
MLDLKLSEIFAKPRTRHLQAFQILDAGQYNGCAHALVSDGEKPILNDAIRANSNEVDSCRNPAGDSRRGSCRDVGRLAVTPRSFLSHAASPAGRTVMHPEELGSSDRD